MSQPSKCTWHLLNCSDKEQSLSIPGRKQGQLPYVWRWHECCCLSSNKYQLLSVSTMLQVGFISYSIMTPINNPLWLPSWIQQHLPREGSLQLYIDGTIKCHRFLSHDSEAGSGQELWTYTKLYTPSSSNELSICQDVTVGKGYKIGGKEGEDMELQITQSKRYWQ